VKRTLFTLSFIVTALVAAQTRREPANPLTLRSKQVAEVLDGSDGLPFEYHMLWNKAVIHGEDSGQPVAVTVFRREPYAFHRITVRPANADVGPAEADFHFNVRDLGESAATFTLRQQGTAGGVARRMESEVDCGVCALCGPGRTGSLHSAGGKTRGHGKCESRSRCISR
jgi:hypothetical protein